MAKGGNLNFHETFKPERQYIGSILNVANMPGAMTIQEISNHTGIPNGDSSGKVVPHIRYAEYMGLIEVVKSSKDEYLFNRTKLGEVVYREDEGLQEKLTITLCYAMLLREKNDNAFIWRQTVKEILPDYRNEISIDILIKELERELDRKLSKDSFRPFKMSIMDLFDELNVLVVNGDKIECKCAIYDKELIYLYAYILLEYWDDVFPEEEEISSIQLMKLRFGKIFGWDEQKEYEVLEHLSDKGMIRLNRQLVPYTILRLVEKESVMEKLYSELC